jgi:hypothetical protein
MRISNYTEVRDALYHRETFVHGSCHGARRDGFTSSVTGNVIPGVFEVWSYSTLILTYDLDTSTVRYFDNRRYSNTTGRLQNMIRAAFPPLDGSLYNARVVYDGDCTLV